MKYLLLIIIEYLEGSIQSAKEYKNNHEADKVFLDGKIAAWEQTKRMLKTIMDLGEPNE